MPLNLTYRSVAQFEAIPARHNVLITATPANPGGYIPPQSFSSALYVALKPFPDARVAVVELLRKTVGLDIEK